MTLSDIPLQDIQEKHLLRLISAQAAESLHVEYKRETYGGNDDQRREFLADVSSFANASGGDLIIGMIAVQGAPTKFHPYAGDADAERQRLEAMARDGLQPRITGPADQAGAKRPHQVEFIAELPKTATGKIQRFKLRELSLSDAKCTSRGTP